jgi:hypothetical protein
LTAPQVTLRESVHNSRRSVVEKGWPLRLSWLAFAASSIAFAIFVRLTLYDRVGLQDIGVKGLAVPVAVLGLLLLWLAIAARLLKSWSRPYVALSFLPLLAVLPIIFGILYSEQFARDYWVDRSLKIELLLGLPSVVLLLQLGLWLCSRYRLNWGAIKPMLAVLAVGLGLRLFGMGWGLPFAFQPEETSIYFRWAMELALGGEWNPHYFQNPSLLIYLFGLQFMGIFTVARALQMGQTPSDLYMMFRGEQDLFYGLGRLNSVVFGIATVFVVYLVGRRLWNERAAVAAAALLAVNFLHVRNSQYAVNDVPSTFFLTLSFFYALRLFESGSRFHYIVAGIMAGLAASTKYNAGMVVVSIAAAHLLHHRSLAAALSLRPLGKLGLAALASVVGFVLGTPFSVLDFSNFSGGFLSQLEIGGAAWSGQSLTPTAWQFLCGIVQGSGVVASLLALVGAGALLRQNRPKAFLLLSFPVCYFGFMSAMNLFFVRWVVPVLPFVVLMAAYGLEQLLRLVSKPHLKYIAALLFILPLLQPAAYSAKLGWLLNQQDTRLEANEWAERNLPAGSKVAIEAFSLLDQESLSFRPTLQQLDVELVWRATEHDLDYYRQNGFQYLAVSSFLYDRAFEQPDRYPDRVRFYEQLDEEATLIAVFSPRIDGGKPPFALDDLDTPFWHLFAYDRPGPVIKVYRLDG